MEAEKKYTPIFRYETDEDFNDSPTPDYYLLGAPNDNLEDEVKQLIMHVFYRFVSEKEKKSLSIWHFNIHDFLKFQRVTHETKKMILAKFSNTVSWYPIEQIKKHSALIKEIIQTYEPPQQSKPKQKIKTSYVWEKNPDDKLPKLHRLMVDEYKLIVPETTCEQLKAVFTGQPIDEILPIKWHDDNASELLYFVCKLETFNFLEKKERADYQRLAACFVKPNGESFIANWKQIKQNISINLSQDKQKAIDRLVYNL